MSLRPAGSQEPRSTGKSEPSDHDDDENEEEQEEGGDNEVKERVDNDGDDDDDDGGVNPVTPGYEIDRRPITTNVEDGGGTKANSATMGGNKLNQRLASLYKQAVTTQQEQVRGNNVVDDSLEGNMSAKRPLSTPNGDDENSSKRKRAKGNDISKSLP